MPDPFNFVTQSYNMIPFSDYEPQQLLSNRIRSIGINATRRVICYDQPIYDDMRLEVAEYFGMTLIVQGMPPTTALTEIRPMYDQVAILILDDDGENTYQATIIKEGMYHCQQLITYSGLHAYNYIPFHTFTSEAVVGLENTFHKVSEDVGSVEVCAVVYSPSIDCPIVFPFNISLLTINNTAGIVNLLLHSYSLFMLSDINENMQ